MKNTNNQIIKPLPTSPCQGRSNNFPLISGIKGVCPTNLSGFTLVELIVVITILAILGALAFTQMGGFSSNARDSSRVSDLANISQALDLTYIKSGSYPTPDNAINITYSGGVLWYQGTIGDTVMNILSSNGARLSKKPTDPLTPTKEYTYSKTAYTNSFQLKTDYEGDSVVYVHPVLRTPLKRGILSFLMGNETTNHSPLEGLGVDIAQAASNNPTIAYLKGNYNGMVAKTQTGATTTVYLIATPSIITSQTGATGSGFEITTALANKLLIHGQTNSGGIIYTASLIFSSGALPSTDTERQTFATALANAYAPTPILATNSNIQPFITAINPVNTGSLVSLASSLVSTSLGGTASAPPPPPPATTFTLSASSVTAGTSVTITDNCTTHPTSYTSSATSVATVSATTITTLTAGTTNITPVGGNCTDSAAKVLTVTAPPFVCGTSTVTDADSNSYNTVSVGGKCWMKTNLRTTKKPDGSAITKGPSAAGDTTWSVDHAYYSCPPNSANTAEDCAAATTYGMLYQWSAAMNTGTTNITNGGQGICPSGWHVPTNTEFKTLVESQATAGCDGGVAAGAWECPNAGSKLAWGSNWTTYANGIWKDASSVVRPEFGTSGWNVEPSGNRDTNGYYNNRANSTYLWSSTAYVTTQAWLRNFDYSMPSVTRSYDSKAGGFSLRCLQD